MRLPILSQHFEELLWLWYRDHRRDLPWRYINDPYRIWVSEVMLQQTQVERVKLYYKRFLEHFPKVSDLALASWEEVLECWRGLGYYRRARNMHKAAQLIVQQYAGGFPSTYRDLIELPGIGTYTAAAIASFAFGEDVPALDTNIARIFERVFGGVFAVLSPKERFLFAQKYIRKMGGRDFNYALMDLGALVCNAKKPNCDACCFQKKCLFAQAVKTGIQSQKEVSKPQKLFLNFDSKKIGGLVFKDNSVFKRSTSKTVADMKVAAGVLIHNGKVFICKRPEGKPLAGLWEFPGGKLEHNEDERGCLKREFMEELGVEVSVRPPFFRTVTENDGKSIALSFHRCSLLLGEVQSLENQEYRWVTAPELTKYEFPDANDAVVEILQQRKAMFWS